VQSVNNKYYNTLKVTFLAARDFFTVAAIAILLVAKRVFIATTRAKALSFTGE
jgi:hypothetical protein